LCVRYSSCFMFWSCISDLNFFRIFIIFILLFRNFQKMYKQ
jgi:hypothetical protein